MGKKILITGASGYVGAKLYTELKKNSEFEVFGTYFSNKFFDELIQADLRDLDAVKRLVETVDPDVIIHNAANAKSAWSDEFPGDARKLNFETTENLVNTAKSKDIKFIFISSFAAFDPINNYGKFKLESENLVATLPNHVNLRPSLIIGLSPNTENDRPFNQIMQDIIKKKTSEYDSSTKFNITYLKHLCEVIEKIIIDDIKNMMIPVISDGEISRYEIAKQILTAFDLEPIEVNKNRIIANPEIDFGVYKKFGLPSYTVDEVLEDIINEIKQYLNERKV